MAAATSPPPAAWPIGEPQLFAQLIRTLVEATTDYLLAQAAAGAEALMLFDSWAGILVARAVPPLGDRADRADRPRHPQGEPDIPIIGFPRLAGRMLAEYAQRTGVQCLGVDTTMDLRWAAGAVAGAPGAAGQPRPAGAGRRRHGAGAEARSILGTMRGRPYIFNLGHGIEKVTPPEHVAALVRLVRTG